MTVGDLVFVGFPPTVTVKQLRAAGEVLGLDLAANGGMLYYRDGARAAAAPPAARNIVAFPQPRRRR